MPQKSSTNSTTQNTPWAPQAAALNTAFNQAGTALNTANGVPTPQQLIASMSPDQLATYQSMVGYGNGNSALPASEAAAGTTMTNAGTSGVQGALTGLQGFNPATANNTQSIMDAATKYATGANNYVPDAVANAELPAMQQLRDVTNPGTEANAAGTGNTNSSRTGIAEGIADRGLAENAQSMAGAMENQNYQTGLGIAESGAQSNNANTLGALTSAGNLGGNAFNSGVTATGQSIGDQGNLYSLAAAGGAGETAATQAGLSNTAALYGQNVQAPFAGLDQYMGIVGSNNWGGTSNTQGTTTTTPSATQVAGGLISGLGSFLSPTFGIGKYLPFGATAAA